MAHYQGTPTVQKPEHTPKSSVAWAQKIFWVVFLLIPFTHLRGQTQRYPANVSPTLNAPYSLYISDYSDPGKNQLNANIVFNDFNEVVWNFKLRLTIESSDVRLQTLPNFTPVSPISVQPGVLTQITSDQWIEYFDFNNLEISGSGFSALQNSGRLPEGMYSVCLEVLDYDTGDPLSRETCTTAWIQLSDPPRVISPTCGRTIDPKLTAFPIQWQLFNTRSPNSMAGAEYQLTLWEVTELGADPILAVPNGQALQVFQSEFTAQTNFNYGPAEPLLELGKTYVWRVQAQTPDGRDSFKNDGYSEFCYFHYGWPEGGSIELKWPKNEGGFLSEEQPYLSWSGAGNQQPGQPVEYLFEVTEIVDGQSPEEAYVKNPTWLSKRQSKTFKTFGGSNIIPPLAKSGVYVWKVSAFTDEQKIAESELSIFNGPSLVEYFYAGNHRVNVDYINGKDVTKISGSGTVRLTEDPNDWTELTFENISLKDNGGFWIMEDGEIFIEISDPKIVELNPFYSDNGGAIFEIDRYRLDNVGLYAFGTTHWDLPFATLSKDKPVMHSVKQWANYNEFKVNTVIKLPKNSNRFDLLDPYDFTIDLDSSSLIYINRDRFRFELNGKVYIPEKVSRYDSERAAFPFSRVTNLFYMTTDSSDNYSNPIQPLKNTLYWMRPSSYVIDFSEKKSPGSQIGNPAWKGIDIGLFKMTYEKSPDHKGQLTFDSLVSRGYGQEGTNRYAHVTANGLSLRLKTDYKELDEKLKFQTFPSTPLELNLDITDNQVSDGSYLNGDFLIPFVSLEKRFSYQIPINNQGFEKGHLVDVEGTNFTFNPEAGDQEIFVTIQRAALSGNERITMTIDMDWPGMGLQLTELRDFKVWGDYSVGFSTKNGTVALEQRENALMSSQQYPVTVDIIGAGSYNGQYLFATTADIVLGEDVSGPEQEPKVNVYSYVANPFVTEEAAGAIGELPGEGPTVEEVTAEIEAEIAAYEESLLAKLNGDFTAANEAALAYQQGLVSGATLYAPEDIVLGTSLIQSSIDDFKENKLYPKAKALFRKTTNIVLEPVKKKTDSLNATIQNAITDEANKVLQKSDNAIDGLVGVVRDELISILQNDKIDVSPIITELAGITSGSLKQEVESSLNQAVSNQLRFPIQTLITDQVLGRVSNHIADGGVQLIRTSIEGGDGKKAFGDLLSGIPGAAKDAMAEVVDFVSYENLSSTVTGLAEEFVGNIDLSAVSAEIKGNARKKILEALAKLAGDLVADAVSEQLEQMLPPFPGGISPISFANAGAKILQGDLGAAAEALFVDPVPIKSGDNNKLVWYEGFIHFTPNDPNYGNVWVGELDMIVKVPKEIGLGATYINGRKDDVSYWFVEIRAAADESSGSYKLGDPIDKTPKELKKPTNMGFAKIVGISGRLFHHMSENENGGIAPDPEMRFGAFMNMVFFDKKTNGKNMRLAVAGEINTKNNGDYTLEFNGDLQVRSETPSVTTIDEFAPIQGIVNINYNSAEEHFFGYAKVVLNKPGTLCAEGSLLVDVKPGAWRVALGHREDRLRFVPGCVGWSPTGWLDINQNEAELGLGVEWSISASTPTINVIVYKVKFGVEAGLAAGIMAAVQYNPNLALSRAGIWADLYAQVIMRHKRALGKWKSVVLVDISLSGDLTLYFIPKPTIVEGDLRGRIKVLFFNKSIKAHMRKEL